jgi:hypothetical protein
MKNTNWKDTAELLGIVAIVLSLVFVGVQLRLDRDVSIVDARGALTDRVINLTELISSREDVWKRGLDNEELSPMEEIQFIAMADAVRSHFFTQWVRWGRIGPVDPDIAPKSYAYALYAHPGLRRAMESDMQFRQDRESAFGSVSQGSGFDPLVDGFLLELEKSNNAPNRRYIFW